MKTRIVELSPTEFVPQVWEAGFLWSGKWRGLEYFPHTRDPILWEEPSSMLRYCVMPTRQEAEKIVLAYLNHIRKEEALR